MTQVTNPTTAVSSVQNPQGGRDIIGIQGENRLNGTAQSDIILTFAANDVIAGGAGDDLVLAGAGNDSIGGGPGNDNIFAGPGGDAVSGGDGDDTRLFGGKGNDTIDGNSGNDLVSGDQGNDVVLGGVGNDTAFGGQGNDIVGGGDGNDSLRGGKGNDTVDGGAGDDIIHGDRGADVLIGGAGRDTFYFAAPVGGDFGLDTITDFNPLEDKISLSKSAFSGLGATFDASEFIVVSGFSTSSPGANTVNKVIYDQQSGLLYFNSGSGVQTIAQLQPGLSLNTSGNTNFELF